MNTPYTPGPWHIAAGGRGESHRITNGETSIAHVLPIGEDQYANARLIKTAPELLEALQAAMFYVPVETKARVLGDLAIDKALGYDKDKGYMP